jgi:hypothetical protein
MIVKISYIPTNYEIKNIIVVEVTEYSAHLVFYY